MPNTECRQQGCMDTTPEVDMTDYVMPKLLATALLVVVTVGLSFAGSWGQVSNFKFSAPQKLEI